MLTISNLSVKYDKKSVIENLEISFECGKIHGLIGLNGAGKTTFLNTIYGYKKKELGEITLNSSELKRKKIAYLETENFFYSDITGKEYLNLFNTQNSNYKLEDWNTLFKLPLNQLISSYSTGMKKKLAIMSALKQDKEIIILDEPFNGLDMESSKILSLILTKLKEKGKTIIITSHILGSLTDICDSLNLLRDKKIAFTKNRAEFIGIESEIFKDLEEEHNVLIDNVIK